MTVLFWSYVAKLQIESSEYGMHVCRSWWEEEDQLPILVEADSRELMNVRSNVEPLTKPSHVLFLKAWIGRRDRSPRTRHSTSETYSPQEVLPGNFCQLEKDQLSEKGSNDRHLWFGQHHCNTGRILFHVWVNYYKTAHRTQLQESDPAVDQ